MFFSVAFVVAYSVIKLFFLSLLVVGDFGRFGRLSGVSFLGFVSGGLLVLGYSG